MTAFVNRHNHESELIKSAAEGLGFLYSEPVRTKWENGMFLKIFLVDI